MTKEKVFSVEMKPSYLCNQDCVMCPYPEKHPDMTMSWGEVEKNLEFIKENFEFERFDLSGGEPTIYKHFFDILGWFKENLPKVLINIHTNGVKFSDEEFAKRVSEYNIRCFVSFHFPNSEITRKITRRDHYKKIILGIKGMADNSIPIYVDVVLTKLNQDLLEDINENLSVFPIKYIEYRLAHLTNKKNLDVYKPDIVGLKEKVVESFKRLKIKGVKISFANFPKCFFDHEKLKLKGEVSIIFIDKKNQLEKYSEGGNYESSIAEEKYYKNFVKDENCVACVFNKECKGIDKEYKKNVKLKAIKKN